MRTLIDLTDDQISILAEMAREQKKSRAALVREGVSRLIDDYRETRRLAAIDAAFGIWKDKVEDGVEYQKLLRAEWDDVDKRIDERLDTGKW
jgi:hypothetical protein